MGNLGSRASLALVVAIVATSFVSEAGADPSPPPSPSASPDAPDKAACLAAYEKGQVLHLQRKLRATLAQFRICAASTCPAVVRSDCSEAEASVEADLSSILVTANADSGRDITGAAVIVDDERIADRLGDVTPVDPGKHVLRVLLPDGTTAEETFVIVLGEKSKEVRVDFPHREPIAQSPPIPPPTPAIRLTRPVPKVIYPVAALGAAGLAGFGVFATWGQATLPALEKCKPNCTSSQVSTVYTRFTVADVSLAVGAVATAAVATIWFMRPTEKAPISAKFEDLVAGRIRF